MENKKALIVSLQTLFSNASKDLKTACTMMKCNGGNCFDKTIQETAKIVKDLDYCATIFNNFIKEITEE